MADVLSKRRIRLRVLQVLVIHFFFAGQQRAKPGTNGLVLQHHRSEVLDHRRHFAEQSGLLAEFGVGRLHQKSAVRHVISKVRVGAVRARAKV